MRCTLTRGNNAIMTAGTGTDDLGMIHRTWNQRCKCLRRHTMTGIAGIGTINVRRTLARCHYPIVTFGTGTDDLGMVHV